MNIVLILICQNVCKILHVDYVNKMKIVKMIYNVYNNNVNMILMKIIIKIK